MDNRAQIEIVLTEDRARELRINPVRGNFDVAHLKEIHRRIFQDLSRYGIHDIPAGEYRQPPRDGTDWMKTRYLESVDGQSHVAYSRMDAAALERLDKVLSAAKPAHFRTMALPIFVQKMGELYVELDYLHPFKDGNSRTLREFTRQLAKESGYVLDWGKFARSVNGRDTLCVVRDLSVNTLALPHVTREGNRRAVVLSLDQFGQNKTLPELLLQAVRSMPLQNHEQTKPTPSKPKGIER